MKQLMASNRGFTLIELLIVVAVLAILAAVAIPSYNDQVRKTRRATAKTELLDVVQLKERFHTMNGTYVDSPCGTDTDFYTITCPTNTATAFTVLATAVGDQLTDTKCLNLSINQQGVRTESGSGTVEQCW
jgi:type IV pilus assembly protein PilE